MSRLPTLNTSATQPSVTGVIDHGCEFEGKLCFHGTVRIGGTFRGQIYTPDTLIVGEGARVHGEIDAGTVIISGEVNGVVRAKNRVEIHRPAIFRGDIHTPSLSVDEGVIFEGSSKMVHAPVVPARSFVSSSKS
jgi:cytoskeletal protein CcmA (bactofilin family)